MRTSSLVFVLWGEYFDEGAAILFVTTFRRAGLRVKIVGLHGNCVKGQYGVKLVADITLDEAIEQASQVVGVVLPSTTGIEYSFNDPRFFSLLQTITERGVSWLVAEPTYTQVLSRSRSYFDKTRLIPYPNSNELADFAEKVCTTWVSQNKKKQTTHALHYSLSPVLEVAHT